MNQDIGPMLDGWPYNSNEVTVRKIIGADGREKIQMRLDLGVLQMETQGRPDAERPHGFDSLLEYHQHRLQRHRRQHGGEDGFWIDDEECSDMKQEAMQYYYRYLSSFHLGDYDDVMRDTQRNLEAFDFLREHAQDENDRMSLEQFRPYVMMMQTRARACIDIEVGEFDDALEIIGEGIDNIEDFLRQHGRDDMVEQCREIHFLEEWRERVQSNRPLSDEEKLRRELESAVETENYERAAQLRDELRAMVF